MNRLALLSHLPATLAAAETTVPHELWQRALVGPANELLARPSKHLRATIVRAGWTLGGGAPDAVPPRLPLAIELLHAGSLAIDDVEDGSTERRGSPALHCMVGVPLAINTGSWLYFWALAELDRLALAGALPRAVHALVRCHHGQALDLATDVTTLAPTDVHAVVDAITRLKTGELCALAAELGAIGAGAPPTRCAAIGELGRAIGIALQMFDDLGSLTAPARRAKGREDLQHARATWPWAWLAELGGSAYSHHVALASAPNADREALADSLGAATVTLGRSRARAVLDGAIARLAAVIGESEPLRALAADLHAMEASYV